MWLEVPVAGDYRGDLREVWVLIEVVEVPTETVAHDEGV